MTKQVFRMCVHTRKIFPREQLLRIVVTNNPIVIDNNLDYQGRSIYIQDDLEIIEKFISRKKLPLRLELDKQDQVRKVLGDYINEK